MLSTNLSKLLFVGSAIDGIQVAEAGQNFRVKCIVGAEKCIDASPCALYEF